MYTHTITTLHVHVHVYSTHTTELVLVQLVAQSKLCTLIFIQSLDRWPKAVANSASKYDNHKKGIIFANCWQSTSKNQPSIPINSVQDGEKLQQIIPNFEHI